MNSIENAGWICCNEIMTMSQKFTTP